MPLPSRAITGAIIDLDGTLVDTVEDFQAALATMLSGLGLATVERSVVERFIGKGSEHLIRSVLGHVGARASLYDEAWTRYQHAYRGINGRHARLYPGAADGVALLAQAGLRLACVTNKPTEFALALLADKGIAGRFRHVFGGDAFERKKPDPLPFLRACEALGTVPEATLAIGDSSNDALAARRAGCPVVLVTYGYNHGEPIHAVDADAYVDSLADVATLLATS
jgi:phosphoglycolate phosphatase